MILSDHDIKDVLLDKQLMAKGHLLISPFNPKQLTPNGYDLRVDENALDKKRMEVKKLKDSDGTEREHRVYTLKPDEFIKLKTYETIDLPNGIVALLKLRSRYSRNGVGLFDAVVDAGFSGVLYFAVRNFSDEPVELKLDEGLLHIVFLKTLSDSDEPYGSTPKSHHQNQK